MRSVLDVECSFQKDLNNTPDCQWAPEVGVMCELVLYEAFDRTSPFGFKNQYKLLLLVRFRESSKKRVMPFSFWVVFNKKLATLGTYTLF